MVKREYWRKGYARKRIGVGKKVRTRECGSESLRKSWIMEWKELEEGIIKEGKRRVLRRSEREGIKKIIG